MTLIIVRADELRQLAAGERSGRVALLDAQRDVHNIFNGTNRAGWDTSDADARWYEARRQLDDTAVFLEEAASYLDRKAIRVDDLANPNWSRAFGVAASNFEQLLGAGSPWIAPGLWPLLPFLANWIGQHPEAARAIFDDVTTWLETAAGLTRDGRTVDAREVAQLLSHMLGQHIPAREISSFSRHIGHALLVLAVVLETYDAGHAFWTDPDRRTDWGLALAGAAGRLAVGIGVIALSAFLVTHAPLILVAGVGVLLLSHATGFRPIDVVKQGVSDLFKAGYKKYDVGGKISRAADSFLSVIKGSPPMVPGLAGATAGVSASRSFQAPLGGASAGAASPPGSVSRTKGEALRPAAAPALPRLDPTFAVAKASLATIALSVKRAGMQSAMVFVGAVDFFAIKMPRAESAFKRWEDYNTLPYDQWDAKTSRQYESEARKALEDLGIATVSDALNAVADKLPKMTEVHHALDDIRKSLNVAKDWVDAAGSAMRR